MTTRTKQEHCPVCDKHTKHHIKGLNHILHLLLCIPTFGVWLIVWLLLGIASSASPDIFCSQCGTQTNAFTPAGGKKTSRLTWLVVIMFVLLSLLAYDSEKKRIHKSYEQHESESEPPQSEPSSEKSAALIQIERNQNNLSEEFSVLGVIYTSPCEIHNPVWQVKKAMFNVNADLAHEKLSELRPEISDDDYNKAKKEIEKTVGLLNRLMVKAEKSCLKSKLKEIMP